MKTLYCFLLHFSLKQPASMSSSERNVGELNAVLKRCGLKSNFQSFCCLAHFLFQDLDRRFKQLLSDFYRTSLSDVPKDASKEKAYLWTAVEEFILVLRCCLVIILITYDQIMIVEKVGVLLSVLRTLTWLIASGDNEIDSISLEKSFSEECTISSSGSSASVFVSEDLVASFCLSRPSEPCRPFLCAVLEVFADELLAHRSLREYFMLVDATSLTSQMLFVHNLVRGEIGTVLEVISAHFILSVSDEQLYFTFLRKLCWQKTDEFRIPELSLTTAISLLLNPIMLSMPKMVQAHHISLVSEVIKTSTSTKSLEPDPKLMDWYLMAFEKSVVLYTKHMSGVHVERRTKNAKESFISPSFSRNFQLPFESYIQQIRWKKINDIISSSDKFWASCPILKLKGDLLALSFAYVEENGDILDKSSKDDGISILHYIIVGAFNAVSNTERFKNGNASPHDFYVLASSLKLMSVTLLSAIWCIRHCGKSRDLKTSQGCSPCKEYDFILGIISHFREFNICLSNQTLLSDIIGRHPRRHKESKGMLLHFAGLLAFSFSCGNEFLVKDCIYLLMVNLNLFIFEDGNLAALASLCQCVPRTFSCNSSYDKVDEAVVHQESTIRVASKFQKSLTLHLRTDSLTGLNGRIQEQPETHENASKSHLMKESYIEMEEETAETCSGEVFLSCVTGNSSKSSGYDDITDFIECKPGKDYVGWLKNRQRYRKWKSEKQAVLRWNKMKRVWKSISGKKI